MNNLFSKCTTGNPYKKIPLTLSFTLDRQPDMNNKKHKILTYIIATVWLANGLFCKVLNLVPRHEQIVARILGNEHSQLLTLLIGFAEIVMAIWVLTRFKSKFNAITQMTIVATMNVIEFIVVPDLLL